MTLSARIRNLFKNPLPGLRGFNGAGSRPAGPQAQQLNQIFYTATKGIPRYEDLLSVRLLELSHTVSIPLDTILQQVTTTPWAIAPTVDKPTSKHATAADAIEEFLDGGFNGNDTTFDGLCKQWLIDILSIDAGVLELVPDADGWLAEIYPRDGATFTKNPDKHGRLPPPGSDEPAYYQVGMQLGVAQGSLFYGGTGLPKKDEILRGQLGTLGMYGYRPIAPIPFSRDQIVWVEENPRTWRTYGFGRIQKIHRLVEIILNQDISNLKYFPSNEIPEGVLNLVEANQPEVDRFREYWQTDIAGNPHKMPILGAKNLQWIPFRPNLRDLQFLESQRWYHHLVWMTFGLNPNEVGDLADVNRSCYSEDTEVLTENGWKLHPDVAPGERIVVHDPETGECRLEVPGPLHVYYVDEELVRFASNGQDVLVTQEHTILYRDNTPRRSRPTIAPRTWKVAPAKDLVGASRVIVKSGADAWAGEGTEVSDDYLRFLGWAISEGGLSSVHRDMGERRKARSDRVLGYTLMTLAQSNKRPENVAEIRRVLKSIGAEYRERQNVKDNTTRWTVYGEQLIGSLFDLIGPYCKEKRVPRQYLNLPPDKLRPLFEALMAGDGSWDSRENRACGYYSTTSPGLADDIQEIAFKLGYGTKKTLHYTGDGPHSTCYRVLIRKGHERAINCPKIEPYTGFVYCFSTSTGFYVTRRNGCVAIQGNTAQEQAETVWRRTTVPLLELLAAAINQRILPYLAAYWEVDGELAFVWDPQNPILLRQKRAEQESDLRLGLTTPNRILQNRGEEPVPWGDMPFDVYQAIARTQPEWFLSTLLGMEAPEPLFGGGSLLGLAAPDDSIRKALQDLKASKDDDPPAWKTRIRALHRIVAGVFTDELGKVEVPEPCTLADIPAIVDGIHLAEPLGKAVLDPMTEALQHGIDLEAARLEDELKPKARGARVTVNKDFDIRETFAFRVLQQRAAIHMRSVEDSVKERVRETLTRIVGEGGNVIEAWRALQADLEADHALLVARTEILGAARYGVQALGEKSGDLVGGKMWKSRKIAGRTRAWHAAMDGTIVPVAESFTVPQLGAKGQPRDYPRRAFVVGDDQPFNCMCDQRLVLREDLPADLRALRSLHVQPVLSERQQEILLKHGYPGETLRDLLDRLDKELSKNKTADRLGIGKATLFEWRRQEGLQ
ncbi:MAG: phage portal protein [Methanomicrobiales archaeon]|nr:phage portal protein [Methanomicrobiales archaeon]